MATGPEHYTEAERLRAAADEWADADLGWKANLTAQERINQRLADLADAQVHATLALAAATALNDADGGTSPDDYRAWRRVASVELAAESRARNVEAAEAAGTDADTKAYVEAYVEVADAERDALRDGYVNAARDLVSAMDRHSSTHGTAAVYDPADPHDAALAAQARAEHVDYAEAEAVREIEEEIALEAAGVESWDQL